MEIGAVLSVNSYPTAFEYDLVQGVRRAIETGLVVDGVELAPVDRLSVRVEALRVGRVARILTLGQTAQRLVEFLPLCRVSLPRPDRKVGAGVSQWLVVRVEAGERPVPAARAKYSYLVPGLLARNRVGDLRGSDWFMVWAEDLL
jgi:hypothetical protein